MTVTGTGMIEANGGTGGENSTIGYYGGGGSGGGLLLAAPTITLDQASVVAAEGGFLTGGGGRILFLTDTGAITNLTAGVSVSPGLYAQAGVISYGVLGSSVPEPSSLVMACLAAAGVSGAVWRSQRRSVR